MTQLSDEALTALLSVRLGETPLDGVLQRLVDIAKDALGVDDVSTTLVRGDKAWTAAYTGQLALDADEMQYDRGYGPCIDAGTTGTVLLVDDMRLETRWPDYAAAVVPRGVLSSLSVPLPVQTETTGALNCYSRTTDAFSDDKIHRAVVLAGHLGVAVANAVAYADAATLAADMRAAMSSRAAIEQAKGIVMARNRCDADAAFTVLTRESQRRNIKVRDVATELVTGVTGQPSRGKRTAPTT